jgi:hypothetical protein
MSAIDQIPSKPLEPTVYSEGPMHPLYELSSGLVMKPSDFPLYLGLGLAPLIVVGWYVIRNLDIDKGLKLVAWLFPLFASLGPLIAWVLMRVLASRFFFNAAGRRLEFRGPRFRGAGPIAFSNMVGIQVCYGGQKRFSTDVNSHSKYTAKVYELNVAYRRGDTIERINLLCHGGRDILISQARKIAALVGVPCIVADTCS